MKEDIHKSFIRKYQIENAAMILLFLVIS